MKKIVQIGSVQIGDNIPPIIQSMTNTNTADIEKTTNQILELNQAGAEIVRITVNDEYSAQAVPKIIAKVRQTSAVPIVGDFHFNGNFLLKKFPECAKMLDKYRINPGNADDQNFQEMIAIAIANNKPVRLGVNSGSVDKQILQKNIDKFAQTKNSNEILVESMIESVLQSAQLAEKIGLPSNKIVLSAKISDTPNLIKIYEKLAKHNYALHLGLTEAGSGDDGLVQTAVALGILLNKKIGQTFRVSITPKTGESRTKEVEIAKQILQSLEIQHFKPKIISCPGCGRTNNELFQNMVTQLSEQINQKSKNWKTQNIRIAIMGCVVNGPGESVHADIGISLPGKTENMFAPVYVQGKFLKNLKSENLVDEFMDILEEFVKLKN